MNPYISYLIAGLIVFGAIYLSYTTDLIKSPTVTAASSGQKKYSFARTQLMWWTVIISCCLIIMFGETGAFNLNSTALTLLGIGAATSTAANIIDTSQIATAAQQGTLRHQDDKSTYFFRDLLNDGHGISTHRFQALVFNILFGIIFVVYFWTNHFQFPDFDANQLGIIGISSGAYLALKTNENKTPSSPQIPPTPQNNTNTPTA